MRDVSMFLRPGAASDAELMRSDLDEAFAEVVRRHGGKVLRAARRVAGDAADDVAQAAFLSAWQARRGFDPARGTLSTWLCRIAHNRGLDLLRVEQRHGHLGWVDAAESVPCPSELPSDAATRLEDAANVRRAMQSLSDEQRTALTLAYFGGMTQVEIQERTAVPLGTVKGRLRLGLHRLRAELDGVEAARAA